MMEKESWQMGSRGLRKLNKDEQVKLYSRDQQDGNEHKEDQKVYDRSKAPKKGVKSKPILLIENDPYKGRANED